MFTEMRVLREPSEDDHLVGISYTYSHVTHTRDIVFCSFEFNQIGRN